MTDADNTLERSIHDETKPIVCTLQATELPDRLALLEQLRQQADEIERTPHGVLIWFSSEGPFSAADVRRFTDQEQGCCQFWGFEVLDGDRLGLRWDGPADMSGFMNRLVTYLHGDGQVGALFGP